MTAGATERTDRRSHDDDATEEDGNGAHRVREKNGGAVRASQRELYKTLFNIT